MYVNCHTHIFNFKSQNTEQARLTLINRLSDEGWPPYLVKAVEKIFEEVFKDEYLDEAGLIRLLLKTLQASDHFKEYVNSAASALPGEIGIIIHGNLDKLSTHALKNLIQKLSKQLSNENDIGQSDIEDLLDFLLIGMKMSISEVADVLMEYTPLEDAVVALMMDITNGQNEDENRLKKQISDTSRAALAYPGRILPFFAVNPTRANNLNLLKKAVKKFGFLGVKLYPAQGYKADSEEMSKVYKYCAENSLPIITHCSPGGFYFKKEDNKLSAPSEYINILENHQNLKICFAHFGGANQLALTEPGNEIKKWTGEILNLMNIFSGVYADISCHTVGMDGGTKESYYFENLKNLIDSDKYGSRILYGSDFYMNRTRTREENYRLYYEQKLGAEHFTKIAELNPANFLGLPKSNGTGASRNIINHVNFLAKHNIEVSRMPLPWVSRVIAAETGNEVGFIPNRFGLEFTPRNTAHYYTAWFFALLYEKSVRETLTFGKIGNLQIRDLPGWPIETEDPLNRSQTFLSFAKDICIFMENPKEYGGPDARLEDAVSPSVAQNKLKAQFMRGSDRVYKFGELVDSIYKFQDEQIKI